VTFTRYDLAQRRDNREATKIAKVSIKCGGPQRILIYLRESGFHPWQKCTSLFVRAHLRDLRGFAVKLMLLQKIAELAILNTVMHTHQESLAEINR